MRPLDERAYQARATVMTLFLDQFVKLSATGEPEGQDAHVNGDLACRGKRRGDALWHRRNERLREEDSEGATGDREDRSFGE